MILSEENSALMISPSLLKKDSVRIFQNCKRIIRLKEFGTFEEFFDEAEKSVAAGEHLLSYIPYETGYIFEKKFEKILSDKEIRESALSASFFCYENSLELTPDLSDFSFDTEKAAVKDFAINRSKEEFRDDIELIRAHIKEGDTYQVNYTVQGSFSFEGDFTDLLLSCVYNQSADYVFLINHGGKLTYSISPELFFTKTGDQITVRPMKGTTKRGDDLKQDNALIKKLFTSEKERAENVMIVDLMRNDLARICKPGSVTVKELFRIETYEKVHQMVSTITGSIEKGKSLSDIFRSIFPCGSITGAPKIRTMEIIREREQRVRGIYCGSIGFIEGENASFNVAIRTFEIDKSTRKGIIGLGSGIVFDANPESEYEETLLKGTFLTNPGREFFIFESLLLKRAKYDYLKDHIQRLNRTAEFLDFKIDHYDLAVKINTTPIVRSYHPYKIKFSVSKYGFVSVDETRIFSEKGVKRVGIADEMLPVKDKFRLYKTTIRDVYNRWYAKATEEGLYDYLFFNEEGYLLEGCINNVVIQEGDKAFTPPIKLHILPGIMLSKLKKVYKVTEELITKDRLLNADKIYLCNSVRGAHVVKLIL
ncbi:MAG: aminodeoxychorismate synthase component I [Ignavibacteriaceae bacterium]|nr:aminodeoxychorismate synthase component I [Ignavibacteriaceae bacterium]